MIHGRDSEDTVYLACNMSRERFTRIIETGVVRYRKEELKWLTKQTGLSTAIFTGEERFICYNRKEQNQESISIEDWEFLFKKREERRELKVAMSEDADEESAAEAFKSCRDEYKKIEQEICDKLREARRKGDAQFNKLCAFLRHGYGAKELRLRELEQALGWVSASILDECNHKELEQLIGLLKKKLEIAVATQIYKQANGGFQKK